MMNEKNSFKSAYQKKGLLIISLASLLHLLGILVAFFRTGIPFYFRLLRFFSWWSVHTSILTILATTMEWKERKKNSSYFSQFITFLATTYNLVTFCFWTCCLVFSGAGWEKSSLLNLYSLLWHFFAPVLMVLYFYLYAQVDMLRKRLVKTLLLSFICPVFYFFYVWILAKINIGESSSLFPYMEKYPYSIFRWITEREPKWFIINFLIALLIFLLLCSLIIWTKLKYGALFGRIKKKKTSRTNPKSFSTK